MKQRTIRISALVTAVACSQFLAVTVARSQITTCKECTVLTPCGTNGLALTSEIECGSYLNAENPNTCWKVTKQTYNCTVPSGRTGDTVREYARVPFTCSSGQLCKQL